MIAIVSDTHGNSDHRLEGHTVDAVHEAGLTIHAGDFTTREVFEAFEHEAADLRAVYGNNDTENLTERLPATRVIDLASEGFDSRVRIALCHGHEYSETALSLLGRQSNATLVVSGHSHQPGVADAGDLTLLNPGSHADPRWNRPAHAELDIAEGGELDGRLRGPDGTVFETFTVSPLEK